MSAHLLIETHGPWAGPACSRFLADATEFLSAGDKVCVFLLQDGVTAAVGKPLPEVGVLLAAGAQVWADRFSLEQRALQSAPRVDGVRLVTVDEVAQLLLDPDVRAVWH
ncbi:hypothetical protein [Actinokineospora inagensis]|uniref:hypothetical protein n=1 Tax=Actinokineospora inagensis TaxID=103730 RepID=UPI000428F6A7|nr:hypothetical protein [Actinokineospora inagensis]